jgi:hypothetical protein
LSFSTEFQHQGFELEFLTQDWHEQKIANTVVLLELIKILVVPNNMNTVTNQVNEKRINSKADNSQLNNIYLLFILECDGSVWSIKISY